MIRKIIVTLFVFGLSPLGVASADTAANAQSSDASITDSVVRQLSESDREVAQRVHVSTQNGVVTLEANGLTSAQANKILVVVRAVPGVTKLENRLHLRM